MHDGNIGALAIMIPNGDEFMGHVSCLININSIIARSLIRAKGIWN
jgi:hypothetical protein